MLAISFNKTKICTWTYWIEANYTKLDSLEWDLKKGMKENKTKRTLLCSTSLTAAWAYKNTTPITSSASPSSSCNRCFYDGDDESINGLERERVKRLWKLNQRRASIMAVDDGGRWRVCFVVMERKLKGPCLASFLIWAHYLFFSHVFFLFLQNKQTHIKIQFNILFWANIR